MTWKSDVQLGNKEPEHIALSGGDVQLYTQILTSSASDAALAELSESLSWRQDHIRIHGRLIRIPRLQAWHGDAHCRYTYSSTTLTPEPMTPLLRHLATVSTALSGSAFNCVLCNLYRHGEDSMGWHADNEPELGLEPVIASWSFGAVRRFHLKPVVRKNDDLQATVSVDINQRIRLDLPHNSMLLMRGKTQQNWHHRVSRSRKVDAPRINLTFRYIAEADAGSA